MTEKIKIDLKDVANGIEERLKDQPFFMFSEDDIDRQIKFEEDGSVTANYICFDRYTIWSHARKWALIDSDTRKIIYRNYDVIYFKDEAEDPSLKLKNTDVLIEVENKEYAINKCMMNLLIQFGSRNMNGHPLPKKDKPSVHDLIQKRLSKKMKPINTNMPYATAVLSAPFSFRVGSDNERTIHGMNVMQSTDFEQLDCYVTYDLPEDWRFEIKMAEYGGRQYRLFKDRTLLVEDDLDGSDVTLYYKNYKEDDTHVEVSWEKHPDELYKIPKPLFELIKSGKDEQY